MIEDALALTELGWKVLPLQSIENGHCTCVQKENCSQKPGKHPRTEHGLKDATADRDVITKWWKKCPNANLGILTGSETGIAVLDVDPRHGGTESLKQLEAKYGELPWGPMVVTGGGGLHYFFKHPGMAIKSSTEKIAKGLDVKADGGYVVGPPSLHISGNRYLWADGRGPDTELPDIPDWLLEKMLVEKRVPVSVTKDGAGVAEGGRNSFLTRKAGILRRDGVSGAGLEGALMAINQTECNPPLSESEVKTIARSVARYEPATELNRPLTDLGNAERFAEMFGSQFAYSKLGRCWYVWTGTHWETDEVNLIDNKISESIRALGAIAEKVEDEDRREAMRKWAVKCESIERRSAALSSSRSLLPIHERTFNQQHWKLAALNGTVNLRTGKLEPHNREDRFNCVSEITYDENAKCPQWDAFVLEAMCGDESKVAYLQRVAGYALTGDISAHAFFIFVGNGNNGKTTFNEILKKVLGKFAIPLDNNVLLVNKGEQHPVGKAMLNGARLAIASEPNQDKQLNESVVKELTGGDTITARKMHVNFSDFSPTHKIILQANHLPKIVGTDNGIWRRIRLVPWELRVEESEIDRELPSKLASELPGILNWCINGCLEFQKIGLAEPQCIKTLIAEYRSDMDTLGRFLSDRCQREFYHLESKGETYRNYEDWCRENGHTPFSSTAFSVKMKERGIKEDKHKKNWIWGTELQVLVNTSM